LELNGNVRPLVSVYLFCRNSVSTVHRSIESVLNQTYQNIEFVIQDGASTDGTLEVIRGYADPRIKLISEPDSGPPEGFWRALNRCQGEIIASCLSDEELLPSAIEEAVKIFAADPMLGAVTRDGYITDAKGKITGEFIAGEFNLVNYLFGNYCPMWVASFFRRQALLDVGLNDGDWTIGCLEFEVWCRLGTQHNVKYFPGIVAKYGVSEGQLSNTARDFSPHLEHRTKLIDQLFSKNGFFGEDPIKKVGCLYNQYYLYYSHARAYKLYDQVELIYQRITGLVSTLGPVEKIEFKKTFATQNPEFQKQIEAQGRVQRIWMQWSVRCPRFLKKGLNPRQRESIRRLGMSALHVACDYMLSPKSYFFGRLIRKDANAAYGLMAPEYSKRLYHDVATLFYNRAQIDHAQQLWKSALSLKDVTIDSLAIQATLLSPTATNESLLDGQKGWAARHAPIGTSKPLEPRPYKGDRKIRVAYYCSFYDGNTVRAMFAPVARHHDRNKITTIAYSVTSAEKDIESAYDSFNVVGVMSDKDFVELVRKDQIDIFIEMSGFSPMHRFSAMALRCAPIQISYFNHSGTSGVPNVDYMLTDPQSVMPDEEKYFTEKVWRLDETFLFFNYEWANLPEPVPPPFLKNGYITFGCFGSSGKVSEGLIEIWAKMLHRVPGSRLYIRHSGLGSIANRDFKRKQFARHGIEADRLLLDGATDWNDFIKSYDNVDISLDTWPYCGANTIGESVWQGVPVITLRGNRFSSRYGAPSVRASGCPELIAENPEQYIEIAATLAADQTKLLFYRKNLRRMSVEHGLSDPQRFARKLEKAYVEMMDVLHGTRQ
jgi:predicted O-linked N-acetylglucosamine transferase (SPINDLY family)/glycosyltransferase involved in cell wall biosynthesis